MRGRERWRRGEGRDKSGNEGCGERKVGGGKGEGEREGGRWFRTRQRKGGPNPGNWRSSEQFPNKARTEEEYVSAEGRFRSAGDQEEDSVSDATSLPMDPARSNV